MINFKEMMAQAQQMQFKLQELQEKLADVEVEGEAGGGIVQARMNCKGDVIGLTIDPSVIKAEDKETLEDLIVAALNSAGAAKDDKIKEETEKMMGDLGLPPGTQLPM